METEKESWISVNYEATLNDIKDLNKGSTYEDFLLKWKDLYPKLNEAAKNKDIEKLTTNQQLALWNELEYLRGCAHFKIMENHNHEIIPILFSFNLPKENKFLREILVESGQIE